LGSIGDPEWLRGDVRRGMGLQLAARERLGLWLTRRRELWRGNKLLEVCVGLDHYGLPLRMGELRERLLWARTPLLDELAGDELTLRHERPLSLRPLLEREGLRLPSWNLLMDNRALLNHDRLTIDSLLDVYLLLLRGLALHRHLHHLGSLLQDPLRLDHLWLPKGRLLCLLGNLLNHDVLDLSVRALLHQRRLWLSVGSG